MLITFLYVVAAYDGYRNAQTWKLAVLAGTLVCCSMPFEVFVMDPASRELFAISKPKQSTDGVTEEVVARVRRWGMLNMCRALLPLLGATLGFIALGTDAC